MPGGPKGRVGGKLPHTLSTEVGGDMSVVRAGDPATEAHKGSAQTSTTGTETSGDEEGTRSSRTLGTGMGAGMIASRTGDAGDWEGE